MLRGRSRLDTAQEHLALVVGIESYATAGLQPVIKEKKLRESENLFEP
jgi:hypothetical protein